jgi:hypothetical protein
MINEPEKVLLSIEQQIQILPFAEKKIYSSDLPPLGEQKGASSSPDGGEQPTSPSAEGEFYYDADPKLY